MHILLEQPLIIHKTLSENQKSENMILSLFISALFPWEQKHASGLEDLVSICNQDTQS